MSYKLVHRHITYSDAVYTAIRCLGCRQISHRLDDLENKKCSYCGTVHKVSPKSTIPQTGYRLFSGRSAKAIKLHWTINGETSLCNVPVGHEVGPDDARAVCVNCNDLRGRGFFR